MTNYEILKDEFGNEVIKAEDEFGKLFFIPPDMGNSDYQRYLRWLNGEDESGTLS